MNQRFIDYYRCPESFAQFIDATHSKSPAGYFRIGDDLVCYGSASVLPGKPDSSDLLPDIASHIRVEQSKCYLPFNPDEVADNLRLERYVKQKPVRRRTKLVRNAYYRFRPMLPVGIRRHLQSAWLKSRRDAVFPGWPVDSTVDRMFEKLMVLSIESHEENEVPFVWFWPEGQSCCTIVTHDVETAAGIEFMDELMDINDSFSIKSSFQIIPEERYSVDESMLSKVRQRGFEINVHDLKHDGHLFEDYEQFRKAACRINGYAELFGSKGFRSGVLYRNLEWYDQFRFSYDMSVPNNGRFDPQLGGCCTVMPYFVGNILEIPVTATQDYSLFHILKTYDLELWTDQISKIAEQHGLISFIVHPDYLNTVRAKRTYAKLLGHLTELRANKAAWLPLPGEVDTWWRQRSQMQLVFQRGMWRIEGAGSERARIAYASVVDGQLQYRIES